MKSVSISRTITPISAIATALASLVCCLPWGIGAALGALGVGAFFAEFQVLFLGLSVALLLFGLFQLARRKEDCRRPRRFEVALWGLAALVVIAILFVPQWVAGVLVGRP